MAWAGMERDGEEDRLDWEWGEKKGYVMPGYHQRVMGTLKFNVRLVNGIL